MQKILALAWKEVYTTYTDRSLLLIMIITPLAVATIIGTAFSGFIQSSGSDVPVEDIPLAIVNLDQSAEAESGANSFGQQIVDLLVPDDPEAADPEDNALLKLTDAVLLSDPAAARTGVDDGTYNVAIIIPDGYTEGLTYTQDRPTIQVTPVEVYTSSAAPVSAAIVRSIVENITQQFLTGSVTVAATIDTMVAQAQQNPSFGVAFGTMAAANRFQPDFGPAFQFASSPITIEQQTVTGQAAVFSPLVVFGAAQALFFMLFTANGGALGLLEERRAWTLQRLIASPTSRLTILLGKLIGVFVTCVFQVTLLFLLLTVVGSIIDGRPQFIWGSYPVLVFIVIVAASFAAAGLGTFIASLVRSPEQGNIVTGIISMMFGVLSGAFFSVEGIAGLASFRSLTLNYWAVDGFNKLAANQIDIGTNLLVLVLMGGVLFFVGLAIFNRRMNI